MYKLNSKVTLTAVAAALMIAGCGGGGNDVSTAPSQPAPEIGQSVTALVTFIGELIANISESSDPVTINALTLATDDRAEPTPQ